MTKPTKVVLGLWPIAGVTTMGVTAEESEATIHAAFEGGITTFDTAFSYGYDGESDRLLGKVLRTRRDQCYVMGKVGQRWTPDRKRISDGSPTQLTADTEEHLRRLGVERLDLLYLHQPDPDRPLEESAAALLKLKERGLCDRVGICNASLDQIRRFSTIAPVSAIQCPLNLIQRDTLPSLIDPVAALGSSVYVFWTLMKGLLAGKITRDHRFTEGDSRPSYPIFQGEMRSKTHHVIDELENIGKSIDMTVAQISIGWAISQPGVTGALVGARRPDQIRETLLATTLDEGVLQQIDSTVSRHFGS